MPPTKGQKFVHDLLERVLATFLQAFLAAVLATAAVTAPDGSHINVDWLNSIGIGLLAALAALLTTVLVWMINRKPIANPYFDLGYRSVITFGQTLVGYVTAAGVISALKFDWNTAVLASLLAAGQALLKGLIGLSNIHTAGASLAVRKT